MGSEPPAGTSAEKTLPGFAPPLGKVGPYRILELLGQGGMAAVYRARDERDGTEAAVKILARMRPSWVQRFAREFESARRVDHVNVVKVLEAGDEDGLAYFSMERVEGVTASRYVLKLTVDDPLPPPPPQERVGPPEPVDRDVLGRTLEVAIQLAMAVGAIHGVGLVHRDLKPGNVLVTGNGVVKLVDFGVAKWLEEQTSFTQIGHVVGSYSYMAPEQITGAQVDHRADQYGMGVLVYELLSGAPPFRARRPQEYLWLHCTEQPEPLSRRLTGVPASLDRLLLRMLAKEPADRPESMAAVAEELRGIQAEVEGNDAGASMELVLDEEDRVELEEPPWESARVEPTEDTTLKGKARAQQHPEEEATERHSRRSSWPGPAGTGEERRSLDGDPFGPPSEVEVLRAQDPTMKVPALPKGATRRKTLLPGEGRRPTGGHPTATASGMAALVTPRYVGRKAELDALMANLKQVRKKGVQAVLIEGEAGIGKTRLVHTFRGLSWVKGARVAIGRCHRGGGALCAPFHDILLRLAGPALPRNHHERILGPDRALLTRFFPALAPRGEVVEPQGIGNIGNEKEDQAGLYRAVCGAVRRSSRDAPLVIVLEDIQWADPGTSRLVTVLLRRLTAPQPAQVLLVMTYRGEDVDSSEASRPMLIPTVEALPNVRSQVLEPLSQEETLEVISSVTVDVEVAPGVLSRVAKAADGNPRFAVEVARSLVVAGGAASSDEGWELPTSLLEAYSHRLETLDKSARDVARTIAVLGGRPPNPIVETATGLDSAVFTEALTELERRKVIDVDRRGDQDTLALHSEVLRAAVLDSLSTKQARALHRRAAASWLKAGRQQTQAAGQAARHLYAAGENRAAFPHALEAAFQAGEGLDYSSVRRWMAQIGNPGAALDEVSEEAVYRYYMLRFLLAFGDGVLDAAEEAVAKAASAAQDVRSQLYTGIACARIHTRTGNYLAAVQVCRRGLREGRGKNCLDLAVGFAIQGARAARRSGDNPSALAWLAEADLIVTSNADLRGMGVRVAWIRSAVLLELHREGEAETEIHRAVQLASRAHQERAEAGLRSNLAILCWRRGEITEAVDEIERARHIFTELGEWDQVALTEGTLAHLRLLQGRIDEADRLARSCWNSYRRLRDREGILQAACVLLAVARARQDEPEAESVMSVAGDGPETGQTLELAWVDYWMQRGRWHRTRDQLDQAARCVEKAEVALGEQPPPYRRRDLDLLRAELFYDQGQFEPARALFDTIAMEAENEKHWPVHWWARAARSATAAQLGQVDDPTLPPEDLLSSNVPLALATLWYRAEAHDARNEHEEARATYSEGLAISRDTGFIEWTNRFFPKLNDKS